MNYKITHSKALEAVARYKRSEIELIEILEEVWTYKTFYHFKCNSLFRYAVDELKLSPEVTSIFNKVMKKTLIIPGFKEQIRNGNISISNASRICSVITKDNKERWFELARLPKSKLEREVALASPRAAIRERARMKAIGNVVRYELQYGVSEEHMQDIKRAQDLLSQKLGRAALFEDVSNVSVNLFLDKNDPLRKCLGTKIKTSVSQGRQLQVTVKRRVHHNNESQCSHINAAGERCQERRHLHIHHIKAISEGGTNDISNLTILCSGHHRAHHLQR